MARQAVLFRTKLYEHRKGRYREAEWNLVNTSVGACLEPVGNRLAEACGAENFDPDDPIARVDKIEFNWDNGAPYTIQDLGDERVALTGGFQVLGRKFRFLPSDSNVE